MALACMPLAHRRSADNTARIQRNGPEGGRADRVRPPGSGE